MKIKQYVGNGIDIAKEVLSGNLSHKDLELRTKYTSTKMNNGEILNVPRYGALKLGIFNCSKYTRFAAKELFNKKYNPCHAWNRRYNSDEVVEVKDSDIYSKILQAEPGSIIGINVPFSNYQNGLDEKHQQRELTHVILYLGINKDGEPLFSEQSKAKCNILGIEDLENKGYKAREIYNVHSLDELTV